MFVITDKPFAFPCTGIDPITKGQFIIESAYMLWNEDGADMLSRAKGVILIEGPDNPLYEIAKEFPLRLQGLVASVMFGMEKRFIKFESIKYFHKNEIITQMEMTVTFEILDNLKYLENVIEYKDNNLL